jgi:hypothetical protein
MLAAIALALKVCLSKSKQPFDIHLSPDIEFPQEPTAVMKGDISEEADVRLAFYLPLPLNGVPPPGVDIPSTPQLPDAVAEAPLIRLFNFLHVSSVTRPPSLDLISNRNYVFILSARNFMVSSMSCRSSFNDTHSFHLADAFTWMGRSSENGNDQQPQDSHCLLLDVCLSLRCTIPAIQLIFHNYSRQTPPVILDDDNLHHTYRNFPH